MRDFKIVMYYPTTPQGITNLKNNVAKVHAEAVISYLDKLPYPKEEKQRLLQSVKDQIKCEL